MQDYSTRKGRIEFRALTIETELLILQFTLTGRGPSTSLLLTCLLFSMFTNPSLSSRTM